jgi:hypothetical protein
MLISACSQHHYLQSVSWTQAARYKYTAVDADISMFSAPLFTQCFMDTGCPLQIRPRILHTSGFTYICDNVIMDMAIKICLLGCDVV